MHQGNRPLFLREYFKFHYLYMFVCLSLHFVDAYDVQNSREFYTGWLTHWGEDIAQTDATFTAAALEKILEKNGSAVLYVWS